MVWGHFLRGAMQESVYYHLSSFLVFDPLEGDGCGDNEGNPPQLLRPSRSLPPPGTWWMLCDGPHTFWYSFYFQDFEHHKK